MRRRAAHTVCEGLPYDSELGAAISFEGAAQNSASAEMDFQTGIRRKDSKEIHFR